MLFPEGSATRIPVKAEPFARVRTSSGLSPPVQNGRGGAKRGSCSANVGANRGRGARFRLHPGLGRGEKGGWGCGGDRKSVDAGNPTGTSATEGTAHRGSRTDAPSAPGKASEPTPVGEPARHAGARHVPPQDRQGTYSYRQDSGCQWLSRSSLLRSARKAESRPARRRSEIRAWAAGTPPRGQSRQSCR